MSKISLCVFAAISLLMLSISAIGGDQVKYDSSMSAMDLVNRGDEIFKSRDYIAARDIYLQAADRAREEGDSSIITEAYAMVARCYLIQGRIDQGQPYLLKAVGTATQDQPLGWSRYLGVRGRFEWQNDYYNKATETFKEMYHYCREHDLAERAIDAAHMVAITGTPTEQVEWSHKAIEEAEASGITSWLGPLWNNLGYTYEEMEEYDKSLQAYLNARDYHYKYGDELNRLIADWALGHAYRLTGNLDKAEKLLKPLPERFQELENYEFLGWSQKELGEIESARGNYLPAARLMKEASQNLRKAGMPEWDAQGFTELIRRVEELKRKSDK